MVDFPVMELNLRRVPSGKRLHNELERSTIIYG